MSDPNHNFYSEIPENMPRTINPISSRIFRFVFRLIGWRFLGDVPNEKKAVIIVAPHTSNIDFFIACFAKFALKLKASYIMKKEAFFWPFKSWLIWIGGIPIDRKQPTNVINQVAKQFQEHEKMWLVITPEGTRKKVKKFKTGFARMAHAANVPMIVVGFDYEKKAIIFSRVMMPTGDYDADAEELHQFCRTTFVARHPKYQ
ncbi:lysophospholipid acyltransferase family protein [Aurantivibrio infirmus]